MPAKRNPLTVMHRALAMRPHGQRRSLAPMQLAVALGPSRLEALRALATSRHLAGAGVQAAAQTARHLAVREDPQWGPLPASLAQAQTRR